MVIFEVLFEDKYKFHSIYLLLISMMNVNSHAEKNKIITFVLCKNLISLVFRTC